MPIAPKDPPKGVTKPVYGKPVNHKPTAFTVCRKCLSVKEGCFDECKYCGSKQVLNSTPEFIALTLIHSFDKE